MARRDRSPLGMRFEERNFEWFKNGQSRRRTKNTSTNRNRLFSLVKTNVNLFWKISISDYTCRNHKIYSQKKNYTPHSSILRNLQSFTAKIQTLNLSVKSRQANPVLDRLQKVQVLHWKSTEKFSTNTDSLF